MPQRPAVFTWRGQSATSVAVFGAREVLEGEDWSYDVLDVGSGSGDDGSDVGRLFVHGPTLGRLVGVFGVGGKDDLALF